MAPSRSTLSRRTLLAATWLVGGVVAVAVGFGAVALVGDEVTERSAAALSQQAVQAALTGRAATSASPVPRPRGSGVEDDTGPIPSLSPSPPTGPTGTTGSTGPTGPTGSRQSRGTATPSSRPATAGPPAARLGSYQLNGGKVVVACTGSVITLRYAVPKDGYRSAVHPSATSIEVEFEGQDHHSHLSVTCRDGRPVEQVEEDGEEDSPGDHFTGAATPR
jgi:hypothetical protein